MRVSLMWLLFAVLAASMSCGPNHEKRLKRQKNRTAEKLYNSITHEIRGSDNYTPEWYAILDRIKEDKDTLFFVQTLDFQIVITKKVHRSVADSSISIQDSLQE